MQTTAQIQTVTHTDTALHTHTDTHIDAGSGPTVLQIFVKTTSGRTLVLDVAPTDTVEAVKLQLMDLERIPPAQLRLFRGGAQLADSRTLADCGVGSEATLFLAMRLRGGAKKTAAQPQIACPLAGSGCTTTHPKSQLKRWVDHANSHRTDSGDGGAQWAGLVAAACRDAGLDVGACTCGLFYPNTKHGRSKHACAPAIADDSKDAALGDALLAAQRDLAAFTTITTQVLGSAPALPTTGMRGRPRADGSMLARPRPPDPAGIAAGRQGSAANGRPGPAATPGWKG